MTLEELLTLAQRLDKVKRCIRAFQVKDEVPVSIGGNYADGFHGQVPGDLVLAFMQSYADRLADSLARPGVTHEEEPTP